MSFNRHAFYNAGDVNLAVIVAYEVNRAAQNGTWAVENGISYFTTDDFIGGTTANDSNKGSYIKVFTGFNDMQGRIKSKMYAIEFFFMNPDFTKDYTGIGRTAFNVRRVNKDVSRKGCFTSCASNLLYRKYE